MTDFVRYDPSRSHADGGMDDGRVFLTGPLSRPLLILPLLFPLMPWQRLLTRVPDWTNESVSGGMYRPRSRSPLPEHSLRRLPVCVSGSGNGTIVAQWEQRYDGLDFLSFICLLACAACLRAPQWRCITASSTLCPRFLKWKIDCLPYVWTYRWYTDDTGHTGFSHFCSLCWLKWNIFFWRISLSHQYDVYFKSAPSLQFICNYLFYVFF